MGNPRKQRKKYNTPSHPWQADRLNAERKIRREYGTKNKTEIWKMEAVLKKFRASAKRLITDISEQGKKEKEQIIKKVKDLNLTQKSDIKMEDILSLELKDIMERRLQTLLWKKGLAKTVKQARQFIIHGHVQIGDKKIDVPSYLVPKNEEDKIMFKGKSSLNNPEHPERIQKKAEEKKKVKEEKQKETKEKKQKPKKEKKPKKEETPEEEKKEETKEK